MSNSKGGPQASNLGQIVRGTTGINLVKCKGDHVIGKYRPSIGSRGDHRLKFGSCKGRPQAHKAQIVRGTTGINLVK